MAIQAHHFLCIQGFQGYEYNRDIVNNMKEVIKSILDVQGIKEIDFSYFFILKGDCYEAKNF